ncbi:MAG: PAAR-like domain-containing protein [Pseudomonadota bacterium]
MPDVCQTPSPGGPVPVPYPNTAMPQMGNPATTKVMINGMPALTKASKIQPTNGDQGGSAGGGVVSGKMMGPAEFIQGSTKVSLEGNPAVFMGNPTKHNDGNAVGSNLAPSQNKVMIMS